MKETQKKKFQLHLLKQMDASTEVQLLENMKTLILILRNLSMVRQNELHFIKNERMINMMIELFIEELDNDT